MYVHVEIKIIIIDYHGRGLHAQIPTDLNAFSDVRNESSGGEHLLKHFRLVIFKRELSLHILYVCVCTCVSGMYCNHSDYSIHDTVLYIA